MKRSRTLFSILFLSYICVGQMVWTWNGTSWWCDCECWDLRAQCKQSTWSTMAEIKNVDDFAQIPSQRKRQLKQTGLLNLWQLKLSSRMPVQINGPLGEISPEIWYKLMNSLIFTPMRHGRLLYANVCAYFAYHMFMFIKCHRTWEQSEQMTDKDRRNWERERERERGRNR